MKKDKNLVKKDVNLEKKDKHTWKWRVGVFVFITLLLSIFYSLYKVIITSETFENATVGTHIRSDYVLILLQCILGLIVMSLPSFLKKHLSFELPNSMCIVYFLFLYRSIYLGDVQNFYYIIPHWDTILHGFSGIMLGALGFSLVKILNDSEHVNLVMSAGFICLFAFCFALACGAVWEIYEFSADILFGLNMQTHSLEDGTALMGIEALKDTMYDLIIDSIGALITVIAGWGSMKGKEYYRKKKIDKNKC